MTFRLVPMLRRLRTAAAFRLERLEQIDAALRWIGTVALPSDTVCIRLNNREEFVRYAFPRRLNARARPLLRTPSPASVTFLLESPPRMPSPAADWARLYRGPTLAVYERRNRAALAPLRWGLTTGERLTLLSFARTVLVDIVRAGRLASRAFAGPPLPRLSLHADVAVTLWGHGEISGQGTEERQPVWDGVRTSVVKALGARREGKPLTDADLSSLQIEITLISPLRVPAPSSDASEGLGLSADKAVFVNGGTEAEMWLPSRFNAVLPGGDPPPTQARSRARSAGRPPRLSTAEVEDFLEDSNHASVLMLQGPAVTSQGDCDPEVIARRAVGWLRAMQEPDGNLRASYHPILARYRPYDLARSAFTGWALAEYVAHGGSGDREGEAVLRRHFGYISRRLSEAARPRPTPLERCYAAREALALHALARDEPYLQRALDWTDLLALGDLAAEEALAAQQIAGLFIELAPQRPALLPMARRLIDRDAADLARRRAAGAPIALSRYAELVRNFWLLGTTDREHAARHWSEGLALADWLLLHRRRTASGLDLFPYTSAGGVALASAVAKLAEVMPVAARTATEVGRPAAAYWDAFTAILAGLALMQYRDESLYSVPPKSRPAILGGIRNHPSDPTAEIDTVGHLLLALSRAGPALAPPR